MVTIKNLVEGINKTYYMPIVQREYKWLKNPKDKKIENYLDSLYKGYHGGLFVFYKVKKDSYGHKIIKFTDDYKTKQTITNPTIDKKDIQNDYIYLVYDGQQRLTSLLIAFQKGYKNNNKIYNLYFALDDNKENKGNLESSRFEFKQSEEDMVDGFIKLKTIFEFENDQFEEFIKNNRLDSNKEDIWKLFNIINNDDKVLEVDLDRYHVKDSTDDGFTDDQMFTIFSRINQGVAVKREELVLSYFYENLENINFRENFSELNKKLKDEYKIKGFNEYTLLSSLMFVINKDTKISIDKLGGGNITKEIESNFSKIKDKLEESANKISKELQFQNLKNLELSLRYPVEILAHYLYRKEKASKNDLKTFKEFICLYQIKEWNKGNKVSERLTRIQKLINSENTFIDVLRELKTFEGDRLIVQESDIENFMQIKYKDKRIHYLFSLIFPDLAYDTNKFDIDHIFPKSKSYNDNRINNIANLQFLTVNENENVKIDKNPLEWFNAKTENQKITLVKDGLLTDKYLNDFDKFFVERKSLLENKIREVFGIAEPSVQ